MLRLTSRRALVLAALAATAVLIAGCTSQTPTPTPTPTHTVKPPVDAQTLVAEHVVIQEGLAIALASNVLQTQLDLVKAAYSLDNRHCIPLSHGGSERITQVRHAGDSLQKLTNVVYYDSACKSPYVSQSGTVIAVGNAVIAKAVEDYTGVNGAPLGQLTTNARASAAGNSGLDLKGVGTFVLANGTKVSLGLACGPGPNGRVMRCEGGIAQDFPELGHSIASVTQLRLQEGASLSRPISFAGASNSSAISTLGALTITTSGAIHLAIAGATPVAGTPTTSGVAGGFVLFPATPTGWTVTNTQTGVEFSISVIDDTTRALTGTVVELSDKKQIASFSVDKSGTGTITYLGAKPSPITSWLVSN